MSTEPIEFLFSQLRGLLKNTPHSRLAQDLINQVEQRHQELASHSLQQEQQLKVLEEELQSMEERKDAAYLERNEVVAALAQCFPSGLAKTAIEGWSEDWHGCVYIDLPTGQASFHYHDSQAYLFKGLPQYQGKWDGHTTQEKYERLARLPTQRAPTIVDLLPTLCSAFRTTIVEPWPSKTISKMEFTFPNNDAMYKADDEWLAAAKQANISFDARSARQIKRKDWSETFFPTAIIGPENTQS